MRATGKPFDIEKTRVYEAYVHWRIGLTGSFA
jgi:hypothetical protein